MVAGKIGMKAARTAAKPAASSGSTPSWAKNKKGQTQSQAMASKSAPTFQTSSPTSSGISADQAARRRAAAERQAGIERAAGISTNVAGGSQATAQNTAPRTPAQLATDATYGGSSVLQRGLTMEEANDPTRGNVPPPEAQVPPPSPVSTYIAPETTVDRPVLVSETPKYKPYGATEAGRAEAAASGQPEAPSLQSIRQEQLDLAQDAIDATQAEYMATRRRLRDEGQGLMGVTSSYAVSAGLAGSPFQQAMEKRQQAENNRVLEDAAAKRSSAVSGLMQQAEIDAQGYYQSAIENFRAEREWNASEEEKASAEKEAVATANKKAAGDFIVNVAKAGQSIDDIPEEDYASLLDASGYTNFEARAIWAQNTPEANAKYEIKDGYLVQTYFDPVTQKPNVTIDKLPTDSKPDSKWDTVEFDGNIYWVDKNNPLDENGYPILVKLGKTAATMKAEADATETASDVLSVAEANALGVPYGTTEEEAAALGITPSDIAASKKPASAEAQKTLAVVQSGRDSLDILEGLLTANKGVFGRPLVASGTYSAAELNLKDAIGRLRSGGAVTPDELLTYAALLPERLDTQTTVEYKLDQIRKYFDSFEQATLSSQQELTDEDRQYIIEQGGDPDAFSGDLSTSENGSPMTISLGERKVTVSSSISNRLAMADKDYFAATGEHIKVNEAMRSRERQAELYARFKAGKGGRAAPPGKSFHETGNAVDVANWEKAGPYMRKYGFKNDLTDDRNHFSIGEFA
jgi:hypothetical protein